VAVLLVAVLGAPAWYWFVERVEVPPQQYLVLIHKWGRDLPEGQLIAPDNSYKGVQLEVLPEGRYFINPLFWSYEYRSMIQVKADECLVLTRRYGKDIPKERRDEGNFVAQSDDEKGIVREVLREGSHRINPYAYQIDDSEVGRGRTVKVGPNEVGVRVVKVGKDPSTLPKELGKGIYTVPEGYRGVQHAVLPAGTYYVNPHVESIVPVEVHSHRVEFNDITFPSRDGFTLKPHVIVEYAVDAASAPEVFVRLSDEGVLHQKDETKQDLDANAILQKVVLPQIRGFARIEGSNFDARDFILSSDPRATEKATNNRERFQKALDAKVKPRCAHLGIVVKAVSLGKMDSPEELKKLISDRDQARVDRDQNIGQINTYKSEQSIQVKALEKPREAAVTDAKTRLNQENIRALQRKEVEEQRLKQELENAQLKLEAARKQAEAALAKGKAEAAVILSQNEAEVSGLRKAVQGFNGVQNFAQYHILSKLAPALTDVFASEDSDFGKLLTNYLNAPLGMNKPAGTVQINPPVNPAP
jgi:regulator of protease activity HflC (stomatin/prohibitin superfamily)